MWALVASRSTDAEVRCASRRQATHKAHLRSGITGLNKPGRSKLSSRRYVAHRSQLRMCRLWLRNHTSNCIILAGQNAGVIYSTK
jgi:hypothetical protein